MEEAGDDEEDEAGEAGEAFAANACILICGECGVAFPSVPAIFGPQELCDGCEEKEGASDLEHRQEREAAEYEATKTRILLAAKLESAKVVDWLEPQTKAAKKIEWTSVDAVAAKRLGDRAITLCEELGIDTLVFLGESLAPIKHYVVEKTSQEKGATVFVKVSGSFSGISAELLKQPRDLEPWFEYVHKKLRKNPKGLEGKIAFIDYSATGRTFERLIALLSQAPWRLAKVVLVPIVKRGSTLPEQLKKFAARHPQLETQVAPLHPVLEEHTCDDLLAHEKMKQILGRRSRRLHLLAWHDDLRKQGMSEGMPKNWRREVSLALLSSQHAVLTFAVQPTFQDTEFAKGEARKLEQT